MVVRNSVIALGCVFGLMGCMAPASNSERIVTIQFDPADYDQTQNDENAQEQCQARNFRHAVQYYEQPRMTSSVFQYQAYYCTNRLTNSRPWERPVY